MAGFWPKASNAKMQLYFLEQSFNERRSTKKGHDFRHALHWLQAPILVSHLKHMGPVTGSGPIGGSWFRTGITGTHSSDGATFACKPSLFGERLLVAHRCLQRFSRGR